MKNTCSVLSIIFCLLVSACQTPTSAVPDIHEEEISTEELKQQLMVSEIKARGGKPKPWRNHPNMRKQFERVGEKIEKSGAEICVELNLQDNGCYYYFRLSNNDEINSRADGSNIIINTGMMRFVENDDELGIVMAHEFAHNLMGHVSAQKNNAAIGTLLGVVVDAVAASQGISTYGEMTEAGGDFAILRYSAEFEKEADYIGAYVAERAGYDIGKSISFWRRMSSEDPRAISASSTHPSNAERLVALQKTIKEISYKKKNNTVLLPDFK